MDNPTPVKQETDGHEDKRNFFGLCRLSTICEEGKVKYTTRLCRVVIAVSLVWCLLISISALKSLQQVNKASGKIQIHFCTALTVSYNPLWAATWAMFFSLYLFRCLLPTSHPLCPPPCNSPVSPCRGVSHWLINYFAKMTVKMCSNKLQKLKIWTLHFKSPIEVQTMTDAFDFSLLLIACLFSALI